MTRSAVRCVWVLAVAVALAAAHPAAALARPIVTLVFLAGYEQMNEPAAGNLDTSRVPRLQTPAATKLLTPFVGQEVTQTTLEELRTAVQKYYASIGRSFVSVTIPGQDVTNGIVRVVVIEARLDGIRVLGNRWFGAAQYRDALRILDGQAVDDTQLSDDIDWINQNPYRHATLEAASGRTVGTTAFALHAEETFPLSVFVGIDNTGTVSTGLERLSTGFDWGNAFNRGDDLSYSYETTPDFTTVQQHQLSYTTSDPERSSITVSGVYATTHAANGSAVLTTGLSEDLSLRYTVLLATSKAFSDQFSVGSDYKGTNNNLLFGGVSVFPTRTQIYDMAFGYDANWNNRAGSTGANAEFVVSPGGLSEGNSSAAFETQQPGAQANYVYANATLQHAMNLPGGGVFQARAEAQVSDAILLPSEQLDFGGYGSIRGFPTNFVTRDEGILFSAQVGPRPFSLGLHGLTNPRPLDRFAPYVFYDYGLGRNHENIAGASNDQLISAGPGFTYQVGKFLTARFDYGFVIEHSGAPSPNGQADLGAEIRT